MIKKKIVSNGYLQLIIAIFLGVLFGHWMPQYAIKIKFLADIFIALIKMLIGPLIFCTIFNGIVGSKNQLKIGNLGLKMLIYFELITTIALIIGFLFAHLIDIGSNFNQEIIDNTRINFYNNPSNSSFLTSDKVNMASSHNDKITIIDFITSIVPSSLSSAFVNNNILSILLIAILLGVSALKIDGDLSYFCYFTENFSQIIFKAIAIIVRMAPIAAFGAISYTVGKYGFASLKELAIMMIAFYLTCLIFIIMILGAICRYCGFSIFKLLSYIKSEILLVLATSSSESAMPMIIEKARNLGCSKAGSAIIIPTGYSFNLDGSCIYFTMAIVFLTNAMGVKLSFGEQLSLIALLLITSKGAAGVTGSGFITLSSTLIAFGNQDLIIGLPIILGVDRFMSEARSVTNLIGNFVATIAISKWHKQLDNKKLIKEINS